MKKHTLSAVIVLCLMIIPVAAFAVDINYPDFSDLSDFTLGSRAQELNAIPDDQLQLISGTWKRNGYALLTDPINLAESFSTHFTFQITNNIGGGADWLVFNIQTENALTSGNALSVEFDIFNNGDRDNNSGNHIGINVNHTFFSVVTQPVTTPFNNEEIWHAWIEYNGNFLDVYASMDATKPASPYISYAIDVRNILGTSEVYLGFHAASGAYGADFAILSWSFESPNSAFIVAVDIKPGSCPNPLNVKSKGVVSVAISGSEEFDVTTIDPTSVNLEGVQPLRWAIADAITPLVPYLGKADCYQDCSVSCPDGYDDLILNYDRQELIAALGEVYDGDCVVVPVTGVLKEEYGGTSIIGEDVIRILRKGNY